MVPSGLLRPIGALWSLLSMLVGTTCLFSFVQPVWLTVIKVGSPKSFKISFGLISYCQERLPDGEQSCHTYGDFGNMFRHLPSSSLGIALLFYGIGSNCMFFAGLCSMPTICCRENLHMRFVRTLAKFQTLAVLLMAIGLLMIPFQLEKPDFNCGSNAGFYRFDNCEIGWTYCLAIMSCLLAVCCPLLARNTTFSLGDEADIHQENLSLKFPREFFI